MPNCIVTGATGYIGSHVVRHLISKGWNVAIIARPDSSYNLLNDIKTKITVFEYDGEIESLKDFIVGREADVIMHLAAAVVNAPSLSQISTIIDANICFGTEILEAMRYSKTKLFISTGTYWQNYDGKVEYNPVDLYAATKEAFEKIVKFYVEAYGIRHVNLRLFDVYGEDDKRPKLWSTLRDIAGTDKVLDISLGEQMIDLVHVNDVARAFEISYDCLNNDPSVRNETYGVYSGNPRTLKEVVLIFQSIIGKQLNLDWGARQYKSREVMNLYVGYKLLPSWIPLISIDEGFKRFINSD